VLGRLGRGSQGIVYLARDPASGARVAVKLLRAHMDGDEAARLRFLREVEAAKRVARFCTAQVLDASLAGSQPYIVSEYIPGPSLAEVIRADGPRTGGALDRLAINTATALGAIHHAGIVHRDFKAANVLLGPDGPVVIDFGVAKALGTVEQQLTLTGQQVGTPAYMAPEQFEDQPVGPAADIFAWGATMAFAATGKLPFGDGSIPSVMRRILNEAPDLGVLDSPMRGLVAACLAKNPAERPTAREIVDRLMSAGSVRDQPPAEAAAPARQAGDRQVPAPPPGPALWTTDPLREVPMRPDSQALLTGAPPLMSAGAPAGAARAAGPRGRLRTRRAALIAAAAVVVVAGGITGGFLALSSSGTHGSAAGAVTGATASASASASGSPSPSVSASASATSTPGPSTSGPTTGAGPTTVSGASGSTATTHFNTADGISSGYLASAGATNGIPYFRPVKGDWDWLNGVRNCTVVGKDATTEGTICLGLLEGNSGGGITWYTPGLTAYCETIATGQHVQCGKITGDFGMYSATGVQEAPRQAASCGGSPRQPCSSGTNLFVDTDSSAWMTVNTAAAGACQVKGGTGTDCEVYPCAYSGMGIELPKTDKMVTLGANYRGPDAIGY
jgi:eukaryotic-like serine/threonine-protein kinase